MQRTTDDEMAVGTGWAIDVRGLRKHYPDSPDGTGLNGIDLRRCPFNPASQDVTPGDASMTSHARSVTA